MQRPDCWDYLSPLVDLWHIRIQRMHCTHHEINAQSCEAGTVWRDSGLNLKVSNVKRLDNINHEN